jgi:hypothetical protein
MNIVLHPELAAAIARGIVRRSLATEMIGTVINRNEYIHSDFLFWRGEHIEATQALGALGIKLHTYSGDATVEGLK